MCMKKDRIVSDMYPPYWTTSREGIFMRYDWEFKLECVKEYKGGNYPPTPKNVSKECFRSKVRIWTRLYDLHGEDGLKHSNVNRQWTPEERFELVAQVLAGASITSVAIQYGVASAQLYRWLKKYNQFGMDGLKCRKGRPSKEPIMNSKDKSKELTPSEKEELVLMKKRIQYLETENEYLKKSIALRQAEKAELLKAKKHKSSKSLEKRD